MFRVQLAPLKLVELLHHLLFFFPLPFNFFVGRRVVQAAGQVIALWMREMSCKPLHPRPLLLLILCRIDLGCLFDCFGHAATSDAFRSFSRCPSTDVQRPSIIGLRWASLRPPTTQPPQVPPKIFAHPRSKSP